MEKKKIIFLIGATFFLLVSSGCATVRHAVPPNLLSKAEVVSMPGVRAYWSDSTSPIRQSILDSIKQEGKDDYSVSADGVKIYPTLYISGGAANGAYGAGLLKGWSENGSRPMFKVVTGISTGALTAPFAFLGKEYDGLLEQSYTTISTKDIMKFKSLIGILFGDSLAINKPLQRYIKRLVTPDIVKKIAAEHMRGRRLFVGTVNLDAQRFVVWDMGAIACKGDVELFRKVMLASAAIPTTFPPVYFQVEADGKMYDEMHVDGGTLAQVFNLYGITKDIGSALEAIGIDPKKIKGDNYIIRNGYVSANWQEVKDNLSSIARRSFDTIINAQGIGDTYRLYIYINKRGGNFNLAYIPPDVIPQEKEMFDKKEMRRLFDRGYQDAIKGYDWHKIPPGFDEAEKENQN